MIKEATANPKSPVAAVRVQRSLRWLDSLAWLAIAAALTAMLVPPKPEQASKRAGTENESLATTTDKSVPSPYQAGENAQYFPSGSEFNPQNEADFVSTQNAPSVPPSVEVGRQPGTNQIREDDSPRVTSGPTLNGPELGSALPR